MGNQKLDEKQVVDPLALVSDKRNRHDPKEKNEGKKRFDEGKKVEKKHDEKTKDEPIKFYNGGRLGHFAKECRKPVVRNCEYYKDKMLLAKEKEAGKALMGEDDHWLYMSDDEEDDAEAHMCFMETRVSTQKKTLEDLLAANARQLCEISSLKEQCADFSKESKELKTKVDDLTDKLFDLQTKPAILQDEKINLSENSYPPSDTSSCKAFLGDSSPNSSAKGKETQLQFFQKDHHSDFQNASANDPPQSTIFPVS
ncbi:hypothetical protein L6452_35079 [Arctium lappa]|uniref:Uncharacterized protein n=1 Tax=Arctium lappa TaxID=4217 RepID=A0ACB8YK16_ARCLA|nr:hypothetical protein L6452_35079 [Arctium lappa]